MKYEIYKTPDAGEQCWGWRLFDDTGNEIANGGELFLKGSVLASVKNVRARAKDAPIWKDESPEDQDKGYRFEYADKPDGKWHWRLRAGNNQTIAVGSVVYDSEEAVEDSLKDVWQVMSNAEICWKNSADDPAHQAKNDDRTETKGIPGS